MKGKMLFYVVLCICIISLIANIFFLAKPSNTADSCPPPVNSCSAECDCENLVNVLCASSCCDGACPGNSACLDCMDTYGCKESCQNAI